MRNLRHQGMSGYTSFCQDKTTKPEYNHLFWSNSTHKDLFYKKKVTWASNNLLKHALHKLLKKLWWSTKTHYLLKDTLSKIIIMHYYVSIPYHSHSSSWLLYMMLNIYYITHSYGNTNYRWTSACNLQPTIYESYTKNGKKIISSTDIREQKKTVLKLCTKYFINL